MGSLKALTLAGGVAIVAATAARAADLPPPPPPEPAPVYAAAPDFGGWYIRGDVGVGVSGETGLRQSFAPGFQVPDLRTERQSLGSNAFVGAGVGYKLNSWLRFDVTGEYRASQEWNAIVSYAAWPGQAACVSGRCYNDYRGRLSSAVFLANAYFDLGTWYSITPFIGAGVGTARHRFGTVTDVDHQLGGFGYSNARTNWSFAWALMAGLSYDVTRNLKLEVGYRYLNMGKTTSGEINCLGLAGCALERQRVKRDSHDIRIGMRWMLGEPAAPAPEPYFPVVRSKF